MLQACQEHELPLVTVMSRGYGENISDTVEIHCNTIRAARGIFEPERDEQDSLGMAEACK